MNTRLAAALTALLWTTSALAQTPWHHPLYLGNDGYWRQRIRVEVRNDMERAAAGQPVTVRIGHAQGEADLVGTAAEAVRVCDAAGAELLCAIVDASGNRITAGPVPDGGTLLLPAAAIPAHSSGTCFVYFDNPAAWPVPDFLQPAGVRNGNLEAADGDTPADWSHDPQDPQHLAFWTSENPHSGKRCLKTVVAAGAAPTWIATRQQNIPITGGARYVVRAWVKAQDVKGPVGWYLHVGNTANPMLATPTLIGAEGTYGWRELTAEFTAPADADQASLGTLLHGTGTAWFDDITFECLTPPRLTAKGNKPQGLSLRQIDPGPRWPEGSQWRCRVPIRVVNVSGEALADGLVRVDTRPLLGRLRLRATADSWLVTDGQGRIPCYRMGDTLVLTATVPARSMQTYCLYLAGADDSPAAMVLPQEAGALQTAAYAALLASRSNLVRNPSLEAGDTHPADWSGGAEAGGALPAGVTMGFAEPARLMGKQSVRLSIGPEAPKLWFGWRQDVPVKPGRTYMLAGWAKCQDVTEGRVALNAHYRNAAGQLCTTRQYAWTEPGISGTQDWTLLTGQFTMPPDASTFQIHLTRLGPGAIWFDGIVLAEVIEGVAGKPQSRAEAEATADALAIWPVNPIVKVFQDELPPPQSAPSVTLSAARNEREPLQLAIRSNKTIRQLRVAVEAPVHQSGAKLAGVEVGIVGYVPVDAPSNYYQTQLPAWQRRYPATTGACDGWAGLWPDPLLPRDTVDLAERSTQPVWITVSVPSDAVAGDYAGVVRLLAEGQTLKELPFTVHVWDFALPQVSHVKAIYDQRGGGPWNQPGKAPIEQRRQFVRFMAAHRVCPDRIQPEPVLRYENGQAIADFSEYDKAAEYYLDVLRLPHTYAPQAFYLFGWGMPPDVKWGEAPYAGAYPYVSADRGELRPEFKRAYQACLKVYGDHMKARGWDSKITLYLSDEPFDQEPAIRRQMQALCRMIREVDPRIPIYSSTWHPQPEWNGFLSVWGAGHYGVFPAETLKQRQEAGDRVWFTTDGQMCLDTPYCAVERLLPHYCFKYGAQAYEFWGIDWLTYDPYQFGWHRYIHQDDAPGKSQDVRYPNGDGFLAYPGASIGHDGPVPSIRLEQAREGMEDYEYLYLLRERIHKAQAAGKDVAQAGKAMAQAQALVAIPNAGGRYSTQVLPDPDAVLRARQAVAEAIERLGK